MLRRRPAPDLRQRSQPVQHLHLRAHRPAHPDRRAGRHAPLPPRHPHAGAAACASCARDNPATADVGKARHPQVRDRLTRPYRIELNRRFSYPFACLVLMLVGVPLGLSSKRGGKSTGFVADHPAGLRLLLPLVRRHRARDAGQAPAVPRRLGSQHPLRRCRRCCSSSRCPAAASRCR